IIETVDGNDAVRRWTASRPIGCLNGAEREDARLQCGAKPDAVASSTGRSQAGMIRFTAFNSCAFSTCNGDLRIGAEWVGGCGGIGTGDTWPDLCRGWQNDKSKQKEYTGNAYQLIHRLFTIYPNI